MGTNYLSKIADFSISSMQRITPRTEPDLPEWLVGEARWQQPQKTANGNIPPPSYHAFYRNGWFPLELVNGLWHWLEWDDTIKYKGYWVKKDSTISPGNYGLGSPENEPPTPRNQKS